jgi:hypothetical protein
MGPFIIHTHTHINTQRELALCVYNVPKSCLSMTVGKAEEEEER